MVANEPKLKTYMPDKINGWQKTRKGIYVPTQESIKAMLAEKVPKLDRLPAEYVSQGDEMKRIEIARKNGKPILLSGPTGIGKSLIALTIAAQEKLPLIGYVANEDATDYKMRGSQDLQVMPMLDEQGGVHEIRFKTFSPAPITLAAMAEQPVVLFIDEFQKMRQGIVSILHSLFNRTERRLNCEDLTGENYPLHPETTVIVAINPKYGEFGITRLDGAVRRRFATIPLDMPGKDGIIRIVEANVPDLNDKEKELIEGLASIQRMLYKAMVSTSEASPAASMDIDPRLDSAVLTNIVEVPSPASIVETIRDVRAGLEVLAAVEMNMIDSIVNDFGSPRKALVEVFRDKLSARTISDAGQRE